MSKIYNLQVLRVVAASLVVIDHAIGIFGQVELNEIRWQIGSFGVSIFFIISGFIMLYSSRSYGEGVAPAFYFLAKRFFRVAPIYFLVTICIWIFGSNKEVMHLIYSIIFIPFCDGLKIMHPVLGPGWTLNYEMFFYVLFSASILIDKKAGLFFVACILAAIFLGSFFSIREYSCATEFYFSPIVLLFLFGIIIGKFYERNSSFKMNNNASRLIIVGIFFSMILLLNFPIKDKNIYQEFIFWAPAFLIVFVFIFSSDLNNERIMRVFEKLGDASYCTYLVHLFAINLVSKIYLSGYINKFFFVVVCILAANFFGLIVHILIENKVNKFIYKFLPIGIHHK